MTKEQAWNFAIGLCSMDGRRPSDYFLELVEREKKGEITTDDIRQLLKEKVEKERRKENENVSWGM